MTKNHLSLALGSGLTHFIAIGASIQNNKKYYSYSKYIYFVYTERERERAVIAV